MLSAFNFISEKKHNGDHTSDNSKLKKPSEEQKDENVIKQVEKTQDPYYELNKSPEPKSIVNYQNYFQTDEGVAEQQPTFINEQKPKEENVSLPPTIKKFIFLIQKPILNNILEFKKYKKMKIYLIWVNLYIILRNLIFLCFLGEDSWNH